MLQPQGARKLTTRINICGMCPSYSSSLYTFPLERGGERLCQKAEIRVADYAEVRLLTLACVVCSPHTAKILKDQVLTPDVKVGIATIYRYASRNDLLIMAVGGVMAIASGAALP